MNRRIAKLFFLFLTGIFLLSTVVLYGAEKDYIVSELYPGHNNIRSKRLNLIFLGAEYDSYHDFEKICKDMMALKGENRFGLMQIKPFSETGFSGYFNFWICTKIPKTGKTYSKLTNQIMWELVKPLHAEAVADLNRHYRVSLKCDGRNVVPVMLANCNPHEIPQYGYGGGSFGRGGTFTVWKIGNPWFAYNDMIVTHVHELLHSIPEILDEYGGSGSIYDHPEWKTIKYGRQLFVAGSDEDPGGITKERFLKLSAEQKIEYVKRHCPWRTYIGRGEGDLKTGIFEGGLGKSRDIYRSTKNSIMGYCYNLIPGKTLGLGAYLEAIVKTRITNEFER